MGCVSWGKTSLEARLEMASNLQAKNYLVKQERVAV